MCYSKVSGKRLSQTHKHRRRYVQRLGTLIHRHHAAKAKALIITETLPGYAVYVWTPNYSFNVHSASIFICAGDRKKKYSWTKCWVLMICLVIFCKKHADQANLCFFRKTFHIPEGWFGSLNLVTHQSRPILVGRLFWRESSGNPIFIRGVRWLAG